MYSGCSLTVSYCFSHQNRGLHFIIACWEFPSISSCSWPPTLHCMREQRVWGRSSPSSSARLTDRLAVPSAAPSALRLHCSALSGRAAGQLLTIVSDRPATWYQGSRRLPPSLWSTDAASICACACVHVRLYISPQLNLHRQRIVSFLVYLCLCDKNFFEENSCKVHFKLTRGLRMGATQVAHQHTGKTNMIQAP